MAQTEHTEQVNIMKWWALAHRGLGVPECLLFAIPNGGERNIIVATRMKAEGVRSGVPDMFLAYPTPFAHGLFIELKKTKGGRVSDAQKSFIAELNSRGYKAVVCKGAEAAINEIKRYVAMGKGSNVDAPQTPQGNILPLGV